MEPLNKNDVQITDHDLLSPKMKRRSFLNWAGAGVAGATLLAACQKNSKTIDETGAVQNPTIYDVGTGDVGVLNLAYTLEQIESNFYTQAVNASGFSQLSSTEQSFVTDIRDHEVCHREFFRAAITAAAPTLILPNLSFNFSTIDFTTRFGILNQARMFENTGVSAYNGSGYLLVNPVYLGLAGKIVSVEARQAALLQDLIDYGSFADGQTLNSMALDITRTPGQVIKIANMYLAVSSQVSANYLPK